MVIFFSIIINRLKEIGRYKEDFDVATQAKMFEDYKKNPKNKNFLPNSYVLLDISIGDKRLEKGSSLKVRFCFTTRRSFLCYVMKFFIACMSVAKIDLYLKI